MNTNKYNLLILNIKMPNKLVTNIQLFPLEQKNSIDLHYLAYRIRHLHDHEQKAVFALIDSFIPRKNNGDEPAELNKLNYNQLIEVQDMVQGYDLGNPEGEDDGSEDDESEDEKI